MVDDARRQAAVAEVAMALCKLDGIEAGPGATTSKITMNLGEAEPLEINFVAPAWKVREAEASRLVVAIEALGLLK